MIKDLFVILVIVSVNCDKACDVGEYLDYENCKCRKSLVDKLVDECVEGVRKGAGHASAIAFLFLPGLPYPYISDFPLQNLLHVFPYEVFFQNF